MTNPDPQIPPPGDRRAAWVGALLLAAVAGFYLARGMPWVYVDDLVFAGAGIDLARTGQLANHTMDGWLAGFGTDKFYVQLPFGTYSLAAWMLVFGWHSASLLAFQWGWYALGSVGLARVLGRFGVPVGVRCLLVIIYLTTLVGAGLRPEAEAFGLMFLGLGWLDGGAPFWKKMVAMLLLGFGVLAYPMTLAVAAPFAGAILWLQRRPVVRAWFLPAALAMGVVGLSFLAMIHFEAGTFFSVFNTHRRLRALPEGTLLGFLHMVTQYREAVLTLPPLLLLIAAVGFVATNGRRVEAGVRGLVAACAAAAVLCVLLYAAKAAAWATLMAFCALGALGTARIFGRWRWWLVAAVGVLFVWTQSLWIVNATRRSFPDTTVLRTAREQALRSGEDLVVDASTARYVFDYQLPPRTGLIVYLKPWRPGDPMSMTDKKTNACWVVTPPFLTTYYPDAPASCRDYPRIMIGHHTFQSLPLRPDEPVVIP